MVMGRMDRGGTEAQMKCTNLILRKSPLPSRLVRFLVTVIYARRKSVFKEEGLSRLSFRSFNWSCFFGPMIEEETARLSGTRNKKWRGRGGERQYSLQAQEQSVFFFTWTHILEVPPPLNIASWAGN